MESGENGAKDMSTAAALLKGQKVCNERERKRERERERERGYFAQEYFHVSVSNGLQLRDYLTNIGKRRANWWRWFLLGQHLSFLLQF
jgi:hypothetical protein